MKKLILILLFFFTFSVKAVELDIGAKSAILIDGNTGSILYELNKDEKRPMASMTKIMSMLLIMEKIDDGFIKYTDEVEISENASSMGGSQAFLQTGDKYQVKELLKCIAMASANDAVVAMAERIHGSVEEFIIKMNEKAKELGLKNTNFVNVHGLDEENHYSSAYDMAIMARELLKYDEILKYTSVYEDYLKKPDGSQLWLVNTNKLVRFYDGVDGLKTGYTDNAGYCLTATAKKQNLRLISVTMGEDTIEQRSQDTVKLLNYGFNTYKVNLIKEKNSKVGTVKIQRGKKDAVDVILKNDATELLNVNDKAHKYTYEVKYNNLIAPIKKGDVVGNLYIYDENKKIINKVDLTINENVDKASFIDYIFKNFRILSAF